MEDRNGMVGPARRDLHAFFRGYAGLLLAGDAEAVADLAEAPFVAVRGGSPVHLADRKALVDHLSALMKGFIDAGAAHADILDIQAVAQGDAALMATVHWAIRASDGKPIRDFRTSYQLVGDREWRIVSYVNHDMLRAR